MSRRLSGLSSTMRMRAGATARADPEYSSVFFAISGSAAGRNLTRWDLGRIPGALYDPGPRGGARRRRASRRRAKRGIAATGETDSRTPRLRRGATGARRRAVNRGTMRAAVKINVPRILSFVIIAIVIAGIVNVYADAGTIERMQ